MQAVQDNHDALPNVDYMQDSQSDSQQTEDDKEMLVGCDRFTDEAGEQKCKVGNRANATDGFQPCLQASYWGDQTLL